MLQHFSTKASFTHDRLGRRFRFVYIYACIAVFLCVAIVSRWIKIYIIQSICPKFRPVGMHEVVGARQLHIAAANVSTACTSHSQDIERGWQSLQSCISRPLSRSPTGLGLYRSTFFDTSARIYVRHFRPSAAAAFPQHRRKWLAVITYFGVEMQF